MKSMILLQFVLVIVLGIDLTGIGRENIFPEKTAFSFITPMAVMIASTDFHFFIPFITELNPDIIGFNYSILSTCIILIVWIRRISQSIDIITQSCQSNSPIFIEKIDTGSQFITTIRTISACSTSELTSFSIRFGYNIKGSLLLPIIKTTQFRLITFLIKDLHIIDDFCRDTF